MVLSNFPNFLKGVNKHPSVQSLVVEHLFSYFRESKIMYEHVIFSPFALFVPYPEKDLGFLSIFLQLALILFFLQGFKIR